MASMREVTGNTFGNDATLILGDLIHNTTNISTDPSAAETAFLQDISKTNPVDDKKRILESKGPIIYDSYSWILEHNDFKRWRYKQNNGIFWIKGDPGKGKTMLLCGIIEDFKSESKLQEKIAYFFCQGTDTRLNTATAVIKGLIYSILQQHQILLSSIQKQIEKEPRGYLEGTNAWAALSRIFTTIVQDPCMEDSTFIIDALDECHHQESCKSLLNLIMDTSNRVKWLISSRNERQIERCLKSIDKRLITELIMEHKSNAAHISDAVDTYIDRCARDIEGLEGDDDLRDKTVSILKTKANGTFLWVTLVAQQLRDAGRPHIERILEEMPEDLERLYDEIMERSKKGWKHDKEACLYFLATVTAAERPLHLDELYLFTSSQLISSKVRYLPSDIEYLAKACGSFITITDKTIYFIHQSVKDYMTHKGAINIFPRGIEHQHFKMFEGSLKILHKVLRYDIYNIRIPGEHMDKVTPPNPNPLASKAYCCVFWIKHLAHCRQPQLFQDGGILHSFLKEKYLYWLEAMVLLKLLPQAVLAIQRLRDLITTHYTMDNNSNQIYELPHARQTGQNENDHWPASTGMLEEKSEILIYSERNETLELTRDVYRLVFSHRAIIEAYPLQIYASAFIFSPSESILRKLFGPTQCPNWIVYKPQTSPNWSPCIQTIESYDTVVRSVAISPDNTILAAVAYYGLAKVWDLMSGALLRTFQTEDVKKVIFSSDSIQLALINSEKAEIWDLITGTHLNTIDGEFESVSFCADGTHLALMDKTTVEIRDLAKNEGFPTYNGSSSELLLTFIFPSDCAQLNSGLRDSVVGLHSTGVDTGALALTGQTFHAKAVVFDTETSTIKILDLATGRCLQTTAVSEDMHFPLIEGEVTFSLDGMRVAIAGYNTIDIWDLATGNCLQTLEDRYYHNGKAMVFSADGLRLASTRKKDIKIWDIVTGTCLQTFSGHTDYVFPLAYSLDGLRLVSGSADCTIKVWDLAAEISPPTRVYSECEDKINEVAISPNGRWIALGARDKTVRIWDTATHTFLRTMKLTYVVTGIAFSPDSMQLATADGAYALQSFWDKFTGTKFRKLQASFNSTQPAPPSSNGFIRIWDLTSGKCLHTIRNDQLADLWIEFSPSDTLLDWHLPGPNESHITIWGLFKETCARETFSDLTGWKPKELNLYRLKQKEIPFAYFSQGRQYHYSDELPMLSLNADETWIMKSEEPLLWLPPDYRPKLYLIYKNYILIIDKYNNWLHFEFCFDAIDI